MKSQFRYLLTGIAIVVFGLIFFKHESLLPVGNEGPLSTEVRSFDGHSWKLEKLKGKPMVVNFWASWCSPCLEELPIFSQLSRKYQKQVFFVGLAVDSPDQEVALIVKRFAIAYPNAKADYGVLEAWKAHSLPTTYVLNANGKIVWSQIGNVSLWSLEKVLVELIGIEPTTS